MGDAGKLLVIGGAEDPDEEHMRILPCFVELCGGRNARVVVCGSPSETPIEKERKYAGLFKKLGVAEVWETHIAERPDAQNEELLERTRNATGVFFTGGDQLRLTSLVAGTHFGDAVLDGLAHHGLIVAGTSAGATAMSTTMVIAGSSEGTVRRADIELAPGLGYWRDVAVDTHFSQRGRISRMFTIFAQNPQILGIGIDENTAVIVTPGDRFRVVGAGAVYAMDGMVTHSNAADVGDDDILALTDSLVHVLPDGYGFDLKKKRPLLPNGEEIAKRS
ncbi:MAG TPA: cyanophycinase [Thermoanaerobaculia bacterium]|nr:cyanophycinase [Thermoanaerobaculia bacterium]